MRTLLISNQPLIEATEEEVALIKELATNYGIGLKNHDKAMAAILFDYHLRRTIMMLKCGILKADKEKEAITSNKYGQQDTNLQLAKYIQMLSKALKNNSGIKVSALIKGIQEVPIFINGRHNLQLLWLHANTMLEDQQAGTYQFRIKPKEQMKEEGYEQFKEPYTEEELKTILKYETKIEKERCKNGKKNMIRLIKRTIDGFRKEGIFNSRTKELTSKEYQFLYDTLAVLGMYSTEEKETFSPEDKKAALRDYVRVRNK